MYYGRQKCQTRTQLPGEFKKILALTLYFASSSVFAGHSHRTGAADFEADLEWDFGFRGECFTVCDLLFLGRLKVSFAGGTEMFSVSIFTFFACCWFWLTRLLTFRFRFERRGSRVGTSMGAGMLAAKTGDAQRAR